MAYTGINKSSDYFNTKLYTGNAGTQAVTGVGFQPDWTWIKSRNYDNAHHVFDAVRGVQKRLLTSGTQAEATMTDGLSAFGADGFTLGSNGAVNGAYNYASWNWLANGAGSANTDGSISSTVSVNATSGFSIVKYVGNGGSSGTVGHGLNAVPKMIITKVTSASGDNWKVYHVGSGNTKVLQLNVTDAEATSGAWYNTTPTSSVFSVGNDGATNGSGKTIIAYCFAEKQGYSKIGEYKGTSSTDGAFIYLGFKPTFFMAKCIDNAESWYIFDNKREGYNVENRDLYADNTGTEGSADWLDILSNGIKFRYNSIGLNGSSNNYIYMAFGQSLVGSNNVPCIAR